MRSFCLCAFHFLLINSSLFTDVNAQCPRKPPQQQKVLNEDEEAAVRQPGVEPVKQYIQTTFIHRDGNDEDREYAQFVRIMLADVRPRLLALAHVTVDNENIDCSADNGHGHPRCGEYPTEEPFHFLVVEDSRSGAAVYSVDRKRNWDAGGSRARTLARIEAALLDALSRHSVYSLTLYASQSATNELGFVREVGVSELEQFTRQNHAKQASTSSTSQSIFVRSPTELRLLNDRVLARRRVDFDAVSNPRGLIAFRGAELTEMVDAENVRAVFVLFWHEAISLSVHALELWSRASELWRQTESNAAAAVVLGSVACHEEDELCRAFAVTHTATQHQQQLFAFRNGQRMAQQLGIGDERFLVEWVRMVLSGPLVRLANMDEVRAVRLGLLPGMDLSRPAITIGTFRSEQQEEFRKFTRVATLLHGRYSLAYWLDDKLDGVRLSTFRQVHSGTTLSDMAEIPFLGSTFDLRPLLHYITYASLPDILDVGLGFTTDVPLPTRAPHSLLFVQNGSSSAFPDSFPKWLLQMASELRLLRQKLPIPSKSSASRPFLLSIDLSNSLPQGKLLEAFGLNELPAICLLPKEANFRCVMGTENVERFVINNAPKEFAGRLLSETKAIDSEDSSWNIAFNRKTPSRDSSAPHPLAFIQLEQVNALFGQQNIALEHGLFSTRMEQLRGMEMDPHDFASTDPSAMSGCPMAAHLMGGNQRELRDEL
uniref:Membrane-associated protein n=1 Tax=Globodera pallida TaxID=36090 RepID=A0A183BHM0_GLOPA